MPSVRHFYAELGSSLLEPLSLEETKNAAIRLFAKRDDLLHPVVSGNKWRKLKYLLLDAEKRGVKQINTMGGMYSNHLHATGYLCHRLGLNCTAFVRGHAGQAVTPMLQDLLRWNIDIEYCDRQRFRQLREFSTRIDARQLWLAEGGRSDLALAGVSEILMESSQPADYWVLAVGSATTFCSLIATMARQTLKAEVIGIPTFSGAEYLHNEVDTWLKRSGFQSQVSWRLLYDYHFGGFAKSNAELETFLSRDDLKSIPLDRVYTGKSLYAVCDLTQKGYFPSGARVHWLHTGGLQGNRQ